MERKTTDCSPYSHEEYKRCVAAREKDAQQNEREYLKTAYRLRLKYRNKKEISDLLAETIKMAEDNARETTNDKTVKDVQRISYR